LIDEVDRYDNQYLKLRADATAGLVRAAIRTAQERLGSDFAGAQPSVSAEALKQLKFADLLPPHLAAATLSARIADHHGAAATANRTPIDRP
jgi:ATP-dependent Lhr-like helicase